MSRVSSVAANGPVRIGGSVIEPVADGDGTGTPTLGIGDRAIRFPDEARVGGQ